MKWWELITSVGIKPVFGGVAKVKGGQALDREIIAMWEDAKRTYPKAIWLPREIEIEAKDTGDAVNFTYILGFARE